MRLINYRICRLSIESVSKSPLSPTGYYLEAEGLIFVEKVDRIKFKKGLVFGMTFSLENCQGSFLCRIIHPVLVNLTTREAYKETIEKKYSSSDRLNFNYYRMEQAWEMMAGMWVVQFEQSGKVLLQKSFELRD